MFNSNWAQIVQRGQRRPAADAAAVLPAPAREAAVQAAAALHRRALGRLPADPRLGAVERGRPHPRDGPDGAARPAPGNGRLRARARPEPPPHQPPASRAVCRRCSASTISTRSTVLDLAQLHFYGAVDFARARCIRSIAALQQYGKPQCSPPRSASARPAAWTRSTKTPPRAAFDDRSGRACCRARWAPACRGGGTASSTRRTSTRSLRLRRSSLPPSSTCARAPNTAVASPKPLRVLALCGRTSALAWVKNTGDLYLDAGDDSVISGATLTLTGVPDGPFQVQWVDPWGGPAPAATTATASSSQVTIALPDFRRDLALRLEQLEIGFAHAHPSRRSGRARRFQEGRRRQEDHPHRSAEHHPPRAPRPARRV